MTAFAPNSYSLYDMIGNVWEWTIDWHVPKHDADVLKTCCIPDNPGDDAQAASYDPRQPALEIRAKPSRRLAPLRAELLPPLPLGRAPCAAG